MVKPIANHPESINTKFVRIIHCIICKHGYQFIQEVLLEFLNGPVLKCEVQAYKLPLCEKNLDGSD